MARSWKSIDKIQIRVSASLPRQIRLKLLNFLTFKDLEDLKRVPPMDPKIAQFFMKLVIDLPLILMAFHESAHGLMAYWLGDSTAKDQGRITLNPIKHIDLWTSILLPVMLVLSGMPVLAGAKPTPVNVDQLRNPKRDFSLVALAGPISNLVLAVCLAFLGLILVGFLNLPYVGILIQRAIFLNVMLAFFNLLPLPTLDGLKALYVFMPNAWCWALNRMEHLGFIVLYLALMGLAYIPLFEQVFYGSLSFVVRLLLSAAHISSQAV
jgi:Zn-dependent protease